MTQSPTYIRLQRWPGQLPDQQNLYAIQQLDKDNYTISVCIPNPLRATFMPDEVFAGKMLKNINRICRYGYVIDHETRDRKKNPVREDYGFGLWHLLKKHKDPLPYLQVNVNVDFSSPDKSVAGKIISGDMKLLSAPPVSNAYNMYHFERKIDPQQKFAEKDADFKAMSNFTLAVIREPAFLAAYQASRFEDNRHQNKISDIFRYNADMIMSRSATMFAAQNDLPVIVSEYTDHAGMVESIYSLADLADGREPVSCYLGEPTMHPLTLPNMQQLTFFLENETSLYNHKQAKWLLQNFQIFSGAYAAKYPDHKTARIDDLSW